MRATNPLLLQSSKTEFCTKDHDRDRIEYFSLLERMRGDLPREVILKGEESHQMNKGRGILESGKANEMS